MSKVETKAVYMVAFFRPYPPGDAFHYGLYIKTNHDNGILYHVTQAPGWVFQAKPSNPMSSMTAVAAAKLGMVDDSTDYENLVTLFKEVPMLQSARCAPGQEWRCNHWVRDAAALLAQKGWVRVADIDKFWEAFREAALPRRELRAEGQGSCEILDVAVDYV